MLDDVHLIATRTKKELWRAKPIGTEAKLVLETLKKIIGCIRNYNSVRIICNNDADGLVAAHFFYRCLAKLGVGRTRLTLRGYRRPVTPKSNKTLYAYLDLKPSHHWENTVCIDHHGTNEVNPKKMCRKRANTIHNRSSNIFIVMPA